MHYESEFEVIETINSSITKKQHQYSHFYRINLIDGLESELAVWDLYMNHSIAKRNPKYDNHFHNKLELAYVLYTEIGIHPLHLYFFNDIPRTMWLGYLFGKEFKQKSYKSFEWYDLLHPLPFYPNLKGFCHSKQFFDSCPLERIKEINHQRRDEIKFSLEWTIASLTRYQNKIAKHNPDADAVLISTQDAFTLLGERRKLEVLPYETRKNRHP